MAVPPLASLAVGIAIVLAAILWLRMHAFVALMAAAIVVSLLAPGTAEEKAQRVGAAFGTTAGGIGMSIVMAAVIGACLVESGSADRIVRAALAAFGEKRTALALAASGFLLAVPVFFDTVFYLLYPLARSTYLRTGKHYLQYVVSMGAGAAVAHSLVPPTPGPLLVAEQFRVDVGFLMLVSTVVGIPMTIVGLLYARWIDRRLVLERLPALDAPAPDADDNATGMQTALTPNPPLWAALAPIVIPLALIAGAPLAKTMSPAGTAIPGWILFLADKNIAMFLAAIVAMVVYWFERRPTSSTRVALLEEAVGSAGAIVLITAAGGAFGAMLKQAGVGPAIQQLFPQHEQAGGQALLWLAFGVSCLIKTAQGSSTVALVTAGGMIASMIEGVTLEFHPVYLCIIIGCGSLVTCWMNDSGYWIYCRMTGLTDREGLQTWSVVTPLMGTVGAVVTAIMAAVAPFV